MPARSRLVLLFDEDVTVELQGLVRAEGGGCLCGRERTGGERPPVRVPASTCSRDAKSAGEFEQWADVVASPGCQCGC